MLDIGIKNKRADEPSAGPEKQHKHDIVIDVNAEDLTDAQKAHLAQLSWDERVDLLSKRPNLWFTLVESDNLWKDIARRLGYYTDDWPDADDRFPRHFFKSKSAYWVSFLHEIYTRSSICDYQPVPVEFKRSTNSEKFTIKRGYQNRVVFIEIEIPATLELNARIWMAYLQQTPLFKFPGTEFDFRCYHSDNFQTNSQSLAIHTNAPVLNAEIAKLALVFNRFGTKITLGDLLNGAR